MSSLIRRFAAPLVLLMVLGTGAGCESGSEPTSESIDTQGHGARPTTWDQEATMECQPELIDRILTVMEEEIVPMTQAGVREGSKVFGAAILRKSDLSTVLVASNNEIENPLWHGEVHAIKLFWEMPREERPDPKECIFFATHEPCPLCLSAITWGGYDNFYYLFSYEDSRDDFDIGHDLKLLKQVFRQDPGGYARKNDYWTSYRLANIIAACDEETQAGFNQRIAKLKQTYAEMSDTYQQNKDKSDIPLK
jgi:tRNA(Arg) A34 adenosine deaminase TadA